MKKTSIDPASERLFSAIDDNEASQVEALLASHASLDVRDRDGRSPLMRGVIAGNYDVVRMLLQHGSNVDAQDISGWTALHFAAQGYDDRIVGILIDHGADVNARDGNGNTVLARAVFSSQGRGEVITLLLSNGADPNIENKNGISALKLARSISNYDVGRFFA